VTIVRGLQPVRGSLISGEGLGFATTVARATGTHAVLPRHSRLRSKSSEAGYGDDDIAVTRRFIADLPIRTGIDLLEGESVACRPERTHHLTAGWPVH
jgi:hypothetical protein